MRAHCDWHGLSMDYNKDMTHHAHVIIVHTTDYKCDLTFMKFHFYNAKLNEIRRLF